MSTTETRIALHEQLLRDIGLGELHLDGKRQIIYHNEVAEQLTQRQSLVQIRDNTLQCLHHDDQRRLDEALAQVEAGAAKNGALQSLYLQSSSPVTVVALHLRSLIGADGALFTAVYLACPSHESMLSASLVERLFGLTSAQARVAVLLAEGLSPGEIAEQLNVSRNTVRTHISHIYARVGVNRQGALAHRLVRTLCVAWPVNALEN